tara:strand:+ start:200 stop:1240 length:1041 start_codon:yes stop_codon:yes gene_type:complete
LKINSINNFRAISIVFVLASHSYGIAGIKFDDYFDIVLKNFFSGGTILFVFISGFLFHHVFYTNFYFKEFINKKIKNVLIPYFILGVLPIIFYMYKGNSDFNGYFLPESDSFFDEFVVPVVKYYVSGRFLTAYWYIPFIMVVFLTSPLHIKFIKLTFNIQILIVSMLYVVSVYIHRPISNISLLQSVVYFTPVYLVGILMSIYKEKLYAYLKGKDFILFSSFFGLILYQSYIGDVGSYHKHAFDYGGVDIIFIQKIFMCIFFFIFLHRFEQLNNKVVNVIAATSFTSFFIHPYVMAVISVINPNMFKFDSWLIYFLFVLLLLFACISIALITKKIFPRHSRYIIGY